MVVGLAAPGSSSGIVSWFAAGVRCWARELLESGTNSIRISRSCDARGAAEACGSGSRRGVVMVDVTGGVTEGATLGVTT